MDHAEIFVPNFLLAFPYAPFTEAPGFQGNRMKLPLTPSWLNVAKSHAILDLPLSCFFRRNLAGWCSRRDQAQGEGRSLILQTVSCGQDNLQG